ncbi:hypothetical protein NEUTE1DRAFT_146983 [Neurospora tetrasperma FGSC 2508]|uniref:Uncharacterized protein n=1 Tax=Neurospora tetrasperma (strain FGSC 2508 / ATCC MYA-4615 / P0657) TaxID=510951 RepID=F8MPA4_NEUT8|nr:uncharacterized protein NEUTE1DRAFT_146983 [Neurospora tetrasperma FGSC 2508]EGO56269.1 hypothetical protein NEUTE1DRAFT_146983 [Neurospora tetrasperma FGSC 2508]
MLPRDPFDCLRPQNQHGATFGIVARFSLTKPHHSTVSNRLRPAFAMSTKSKTSLDDGDDDVVRKTFSSTCRMPTAVKFLGYCPFPPVMNLYGNSSGGVIGALTIYKLCGADKNEFLYVVEVHYGFTPRGPLNFRPGFYLRNGTGTEAPILAAAGDEEREPLLMSTFSVKSLIMVPPPLDEDDVEFNLNPRDLVTEIMYATITTDARKGNNALTSATPSSRRATLSVAAAASPYPLHAAAATRRNRESWEHRRGGQVAHPRSELNLAALSIDKQQQLAMNAAVTNYTGDEISIVNLTTRWADLDLGLDGDSTIKVFEGQTEVGEVTSVDLREDNLFAMVGPDAGVFKGWELYCQQGQVNLKLIDTSSIMIKAPLLHEALFLGSQTALQI